MPLPRKILGELPRLLIALQVKIPAKKDFESCFPLASKTGIAQNVSVVEFVSKAQQPVPGNVSDRFNLRMGID